MNLQSKLNDEIRLRGYSDNTKELYITVIRCFEQYAGNHATELDEQDARRNLLYLAKERRLALGTVNVHNSVIRL